MKKIVAIIAVSVLALTMVFSVGCGKKEAGFKYNEKDFVNEIGGTSDTYEGAVSSDSYDDADSCAGDYVKNEVVGSKNASIVSVQAGSELTSAEVSAIGVSASVLGDYEWVKKYNVTYTENDTADGGITFMADRDVSRTQVVYVVKYTDGGFKYIAPKPLNGETITNSYYESLFNNEEYANCTMTSTTKIDLDISASYQGEKQKGTMTINYNTLTKIDGNKIYLEMTIKSVYGDVLAEGDMPNVDQTLKAYIISTDNGYDLYFYDSDNGSWQSGTFSDVGLNSYKDLLPFVSMRELDYTYYKKTDYGCEVDFGRMADYLMDSLGDALGAGIQYLDQMKIDGYAKLYVSRGVLSGAREYIDLSCNIEQQGVKVKLSESALVEIVCNNYGTTVVDTSEVTGNN